VAGACPRRGGIRAESVRVTVLTVICPVCGATQSKACRDIAGGIVSPHRERRGVFEGRDRDTLSVYLLLRDDRGLGLTAGDLLVGRPDIATTNYLTVLYRLSDRLVPEYGLPTNATVWVGWADQFDAALFDPLEAVEAQRLLGVVPRSGFSR